jgi:DNA-binding transcriptional ArsR family regulator
MKKAVVSILAEWPISVAEIVETIGTGNRCKKSAKALVRRHLEILVSSGIAERTQRDGIWMYRLRPEPTPEQTPEPEPTATIDGMYELYDMFPSFDEAWSNQTKLLWFDCLLALLERFDLYIEDIRVKKR